MMKSKLLIFVLAVMSYSVAVAQRIRVVDTNGLPIPAVCVTDDNGALVGSTDNDGWLDDARGKTVLFFSHVAFQDKSVNLSDIVNSQVVLEDFNYELGELVVKPKELLYVQTYYRCVYVCDEGPLYFRAGVVDNTYEVAKKKLSAKTKSVSRGQNGLLRFALSTFVGKRIDEWARLDTVTTYKKLLELADKGKLSITEDSTGRRIVSDTVSVLGFVEEDLDSRFRTTSFDLFTYKNRVDAAKDQKKGKKKENKNYQPGEHGYYEVYRFDDDGYSSFSDMIMKQVLARGHFERTDQDFIILLEAFTTQVGYIDKKEFKQTRKDYEVEMKIEEIRQFERAHKIPELAPNLKAAVDKLFEKELKNN